MHEAQLPLSGVRVVDFSRVLAGPYCTMMLGDLGADVIKVESPQGDDTRRWGPPFAGGESAYYLSCNRNKRSVVLDLTRSEDREAAVSLSRTAEVIVENFKLGAMERWGLDYKQLAPANPGLVYCSISGYGRTGPDAALPGYDYVVQGQGGIMSVTGEPDGDPTKVGVAIVDITAGMFAATSILAALRVRDSTRQGQHIDISLFDSQLAWLANVGSNYLISGETPARYGAEHPNIVPYQTFRTSDGWIVVAVGNDRQWERFCSAIGNEDLSADIRFSTNPGRVRGRKELIPIIKRALLQRKTGEWILAFRACDVPAGPVNSVAEALAEPQVEARGMIEEVEHPTAGAVRLISSPLKLGMTPPLTRRHPPLLGEHTSEVLGELAAGQGAPG